MPLMLPWQFQNLNIKICMKPNRWIFILALVTASLQLQSAPLLSLKVEGTQIVNSKGNPVLLRGVNIASLEWSSDGQGRVLKSVQTAIHDWHANIIRLPLSQDRWFGHGPEQDGNYAPYRSLVAQIVDLCATNNCYIILDLHWSDCGQWGRNIGQHSMPDSNSVTFWQSMAPIYANNPAVLFDLYNEPHDTTWVTWLRGGMVTDTPNTRWEEETPIRYQAVGMQKLLDTVRGVGAKNLVVAGGLQWAYDFSGILNGYQLTDPGGNGVVYANHCYDNKKESVNAWITKMEWASAQIPVIVTEFGGKSGPSRVIPSDNWLKHVLSALDDHHWSWTAWDLHTTAKPNLISDWQYTPSPEYGVFVKKALARPEIPD